MRAAMLEAPTFPLASLANWLFHASKPADVLPHCAASASPAVHASATKAATATVLNRPPFVIRKLLLCSPADYRGAGAGIMAASRRVPGAPADPASVNPLRDRFDRLGHLLEDLPDLAFAHDQRRRQRDGLASDAHHQVFVVERMHHGVVGAPADGVGPRGEIDAGRDPDGADVEHVGQALEPHGGVGPFGLELLRALERPFLAVEVERG